MYKRLIFAITNDLTYDKRMLRICESMAKNGYEVCLVGRELPDSKPFTHNLIAHKRLHLFFKKGKLFYIEYNIRLFLWLIFQRFDAVCGCDLDTILPCYFAAILRGGQKKCIYDAHELFTETPEVVRRPRIQKIWRKVEAFAVPRVTAAYTVSASIAAEFEQRYKKPFGLVRNLPVGIETPFFPKKMNPKPILIYLGALNEGRGIEALIAAMHRLDAELWLVGEGDLSDILRGEVAQQNLSDKVRFWGFVAPADLPPILSKADIGVHLPEDLGLSYRYSLGNKFFDFMHARLPQVTVALPEIAAINAQCEVAILVEKTAVEPYVAAVNRLIKDVILYENLQKNAFEAAKIYAWQTEEKQLLAIYDALF